MSYWWLTLILLMPTTYLLADRLIAPIASRWGTGSRVHFAVLLLGASGPLAVLALLTIIAVS